MRINCPFCGERDVGEFTYLGDAKPKRPALEDTPSRLTPEKAADLRDAFHDYVYLRENIAGFTRESWYHAGGCRSWLIVERNTETHEIRSVNAAAGASAGAKKPRKRSGR